MASVECRGDHKGRGLCRLHYDRWCYAGKPDVFCDVAIPEAHRPPEPNPWIRVAPLCPHCHSSERVFLWANDESLRWFCQPCKRRFDVAEEMAA